MDIRFIKDCKELQNGENISTKINSVLTLNVECTAETDRITGNEIGKFYTLDVVVDSTGEVVCLSEFNKINDDVIVKFCDSAINEYVRLFYEPLDTKFGRIYFENIGEQEENDRIKMYDTYGTYANYFAPTFEDDDEESTRIELEQYKKILLAIEDIEKFIEIFYDCPSFSWSKNWEDLIPDIFCHFYKKGNKYFDEYGDEITIYKLLATREVTTLGKYFVWLNW